MVTEIPGKGRGLVAARDIEKGDLIFEDKPVIKLAVDAENHFVDPDFMTSLKQQFERLPTEAKAQYLKMTKTRDFCARICNSGDKEVINLFAANSKWCFEGESRYNVLHLNLALVNHSCAPNATTLKPEKQDGNEDHSAELRAIKHIHKGEEITHCYYLDVEKLGSVPRKRKTAVKKLLGYDCKCPVSLWVELAEIQSKVAYGNLPQKCPKNDDSHTSEYLFNEIQLISADFS